MSDQPGLVRRLGTTDAVGIGLGSMVGAGRLGRSPPAAAAAAAGLLIGVGIAAVVAWSRRPGSGRWRSRR